MEKRSARWFVAAALFLALVLRLMDGAVQPSVAHGEDLPTPTPTETTQDPGGQGGGGYHPGG